MAQLVGLHNPIGTFPNFLVPIFRDQPRANTLYVQVIDTEGLVEDFDPTIVDINNRLSTGKLLWSVDIGQEALWSFAFSQNDLEINTQNLLARWLRPRLDEPTLKGHPFLYLEVVEFAEARGRMSDALQSVFSLISQTSQAQAEWWRNYDVLLPEIRNGITKIAEELGRLEELSRSIRAIKLHLQERRPWIAADSGIVEAVSGSRDTRKRAFSRANAIAPAFGLQPVRIQNAPRSSRGTTPMKRARSSGYRLTEWDASRVKAMVARGDRHHDIAAWFGVNQGRIAEVNSGELHPTAPVASASELDPPGSPGRIARITLRALEDISRVLQEPDGIERAHEIIARAFEDVRREGE